MSRSNRDGGDVDQSDATDQYWLGILDTRSKDLKLGSKQPDSEADAKKRLSNLRRGVYQALNNDLTGKISSNDKAQEILDDELLVINFPSTSGFTQNASQFRQDYNKIVDDLVKIRRKTK